jgi:hypothetical protein
VVVGVPPGARLSGVVDVPAVIRNPLHVRSFTILLVLGLAACAQDAPYSAPSDGGPDASPDVTRDVAGDPLLGDTSEDTLGDAFDDASDDAGDVGADAGEMPDVTLDVSPEDVPADLGPSCTDEDEDGRPGSGICDLDDPDFDCDDGDSTIFPGAEEVCDNRDNDCDGDVDESLQINACGGCGVLRGQPRANCGDCGVYECDGLDSVVCLRPECDVHILSANQRSWQHIAVDRDARAAPGGPVLAAFNIRELDLAYVLTADSWHLLNLSNRTWIATGRLDQLMPEVTGLVQGAYAVPSDHANGDGVISGVYVLAGGVAHVYDFNVQTRGFSHHVSVVPEWTGDFAPQRARIRTWWIDVEHSAGWYSAEPADHCDLMHDPDFTVVISALESTSVHAYDGGYCQLWVEEVPQSVFSPFREPGTPDVTSINAAFWHETAFYVWTH